MSVDSKAKTLVISGKKGSITYDFKISRFQARKKFYEPLQMGEEMSLGQKEKTRGIYNSCQLS